MSKEAKRKEFEAAITQASQALSDLVKTVDAAALSTTDVQKAFRFLGRAMVAAQNMAMFQVQVAPVGDGFSLDAEIPEDTVIIAPAVNPMVLAQPPAQAAQVQLGPKILRPGRLPDGTRLVKGVEVDPEELAVLAAPQPQQPVSRVVLQVQDAEDGATFLDE